MLVKDWMSEHVISVDENTLIIKAIQILKEHKIRRLPVTRERKLSGIITDRDIKDAAPSKVTSLEVHELYYLLSELKVKDIMTKDPITVYPEDTVEYAAVLMLENKISGLPVIDREGYVVGIITQTDIFKLFVNMTGVYYSSYQIGLLINHPEELQELFATFKDLRISIYSILTWKEEMGYPYEEEKEETASEHKRIVFIRLGEPSKEIEEKLLSQLRKKFKVLYAFKEDIKKIPRKEIKEREETFIL